MSNLIKRGQNSVGLSSFEEIDKLFDTIMGGWGSSSIRSSLPSIDIYSENDDKQIVVELQAPGFTRDDIDINVRSGVLEIKGEHSESSKDNKSKRNYLVREQSTSFARRIVLPDGVDSDKISAELNGGVLHITMPINRPEAKRIDISESKKRSRK